MPKFIVWLLLPFTFISFAPQAQQNNCVLKVRAEPVQQSMAAGNHNALLQSRLAYALLQALVQKVNCQVEVVALPSPRAIKMLQTGELDVMVAMSHTAERAQYSYFIGPHHSERMVLVGPKHLADRLTTLTDLITNPGSIAVTQGAYYGEPWQQLLNNHNKIQNRVVYAAGNQQKLALLATGRVQLTLEDKDIVDELIRSGKLPAGLFTTLFIVHDNPVYFAFSQRSINAEVSQELQQHWQNMQLSGEVARITHQLQQAELQLISE